MFGLLGLLAPWEVEQISDWVKDGLDKARRAGKRLGRPKEGSMSRRRNPWLQETFKKTQVPNCSRE
jgi:DNA invertase Pin-like site-specific DNA recombinase